MRSIMDDERPDLTSNEDAMGFIQKYQAATSNKVKQDLRDLWREAACDFEMAGVVLTARKEAFKETITEGSWKSEEQLVDELKSAEHAKNFIEFCSKNNMAKFDPKLKCKVYYYTKKLERLGNRSTGEKSMTFHPAQASQAIEDPSESEDDDDSSSLTSGGESRKHKKTHKKRKRESSSSSASEKQPKKKKKKSKDSKDNQDDSNDEDNKKDYK